MGKTLLGVDLDESPAGGLVERLLSDEDLEKLTDGGRDRDESATDGGAGESTDGRSAGATDGGTDETADEAGTGLVDDAVDSGDSADVATAPGGTSRRGARAEPDTPSPGDESTGLGGRVPSPGEEDTDDGGWKAKARSILPKLAAALVVLAVVALVAWKLLGKARSAAGDRFGGDESEDEASDDAASAGTSPPAGATGDVSPARRRAKTPGREREEFADRSVEDAVAGAEAADSGGERASAPDRSAGRPSDDSDVGALVGLAALALAAALVRKFGQDRPRDPLVDGPHADDAETDGDDE